MASTVQHFHINVKTLEGTFLKLFDIEKQNNDGEKVTEKMKNKLRVETLVNLHYVLKDKLYENVYITASKIHGDGVFAKRDFKEGEVITFYPAHYVLETKTKKDGSDKTTIVQLNSDVTDINDNIRNRYTYNVFAGLSICGDPKMKQDMTFVGHIVNDGLQSKSIRYNEKEEQIYNEVSTVKNNSCYMDVKRMCVCIVATRDILKDEEILVSYSYKYWVDMNINSY